MKNKAGYRREVIKVQKPLAGNGPAEALIYNKDLSVVSSVPWSQELDDIFGDDLKQYWLADLPLQTGYIKMIKQVGGQDW